MGQGIGAAVVIRGFQQPFTLTNLGIFIDKLVILGQTTDSRVIMDAFKELSLQRSTVE